MATKFVVKLNDKFFVKRTCNMRNPQITDNIIEAKLFTQYRHAKNMKNDWRGLWWGGYRGGITKECGFLKKLKQFGMDENVNAVVEEIEI